MGWENHPPVIREDLAEAAIFQLRPLMQYEGQPGSKLGEEPSGLMAGNNLLPGLTKRRQCGWSVEVSKGARDPDEAGCTRPDHTGPYRPC